MVRRTLLQSLLLAGTVAAVPAHAQGDASSHACTRDIQKFVAFRDPDSIKVVSVSEGKAEVIEYANTSVVAIKFTVMVNSKGAEGGYAGARPYLCWTSEDRQRVLDYKPRRD